jgi:tRNA (cmo5U34)-methyltransferase
MDDPIQRHPTRAEQLDILASVATKTVQKGQKIVDLGFGDGYVAHLLWAKNADLSIIGVDRKAEALESARQAFSEFDLACVEGDLEKIDDLALPPGPYACIYSVLTFHDLPDAAKRSVIDWSAKNLAPGGVFLLFDRLRMTEASLFPMQIEIWDRIERELGAAMRTAPDFDQYVTDLGVDNRPASLDEYRIWFDESGLAFQPLHIHGNIGLMAGARR